MSEQKYPFEYLPQALVDEMLSKFHDIGISISQSYGDMSNKKDKLRNLLIEDKFIEDMSNLPNSVATTVCAVDGSYAVNRLVSRDLVACASVAVEGLVPPSEKRCWELPHHLCHISSVCHAQETSMLLRAYMMAMELSLATQAPHGVVIFDGSLTTPIIYMNQASTQLSITKVDSLKKLIIDIFDDFIKNYIKILTSDNTSKAWIAIPKYSSRSEIGNLYPQEWPNEMDDISILTSILKPGEYTKPTPLSTDDWHLKPPPREKESQLYEKLYASIKNVYVTYFKAKKYLPVFRIEASKGVLTNKHRLSEVLISIERQSMNGGIMEPYPQYLADRMVKSMGTVVPILTQTSIKSLAESNNSFDIGDILMHMHGYRTDSGR